jgi:prepilin-type N-terminal cleavage/methylation domain-containing protein
MPFYLFTIAKKGGHLSNHPRNVLENQSLLNPLTPEPLSLFTPRRLPSAFTLVELMAVVGIMGLLAAVAVPALKGLAGSGGRKLALNQLLSAMEIARNNALASGTNAAVIFPDSTSDSALGGAQNPYRYRSMAVITWNATNSSTNTMSGAWMTLPQGISFVPNSIANLSTITNNIYVRILTTTTPLNPVKGIVFQSDGSLADNYYNTNITTKGVSYFEGTVSGTSTSPTLTSSNKVETVRITRYTGRASSTLASPP